MARLLISGPLQIVLLNVPYTIPMLGWDLTSLDYFDVIYITKGISLCQDTSFEPSIIYIGPVI